MSTQYKIWLALAVTILFLLSAVWQFSNIKGSRSRGRRRLNAKDEEAKNRLSDKRKLTSLEKKMLAEAHNLLAKNKIASGARMLEQLGMYREAVQALEENGFIHDAAKMLMRMQRHNRAGVIYARHGMWEYAAQCFRVANLPLEVAKCAKEAGDHEMAAEYFEKAERFEEAADFHYISGSIRKAAELFLRSEIHMKAIVAYNKVGLEEKNLKTLQFAPHELDFINLSLENKEVLASNYEGLVNILFATDRVLPLLKKIIELGFTDQSKVIYLKSPLDFGPQLLAEINYQSSSAENFASVFIAAKAFDYAGIVYEKIGSFSKAGDCFEKADDIDRAIHCFERGGITLKVNFLKAKKRDSRPTKERNRSNAFSLAKDDPIPEYPDHSLSEEQNLGNNEQENIENFAEESTKILQLNRVIESNGIPLKNNKPKGPVESSLPPPPHSLPPPPKSKELFSLDLATQSINVEKDQLKTIFLQAKFLGDLDYSQREDLWKLGTLRHFLGDEKILASDEEPLGLYIIVKGSVACFKAQADTEIFLDQMKESDTFGELCLLTDTPNSMIFVATTPTTLHIIDRIAFNNFLDKDGTVARKLYKKFTTRLLKRFLTTQNDSAIKACS